MPETAVNPDSGVGPGGGAYFFPEFTARIARDDVRVILELGSGDGLDAIRLRDHYGARVYSFECHPALVRLCGANLGPQPGVELIGKAVWDVDGPIDFHPVTNGNVCASSCFPVNRAYPWEHLLQEETIRVDAVRLDTWCRSRGIDAVDMLCVDLQGACLRALEGLGEVLATVKYIVAELAVEPIYQGEPLLGDVEAFLEERGFAREAQVRYRLSLPGRQWLKQGEALPEDGLNSWFGDYLFVKRG